MTPPNFSYTARLSYKAHGDAYRLSVHGLRLAVEGVTMGSISAGWALRTAQSEIIQLDVNKSFPNSEDIFYGCKTLLY